MANPNGRPKGSKNKSTVKLEEIAERLDCNPFEVLILFAKGDFKTLGYQEYTYKTFGENTVEELTISPELRQKSAKDACEYLYPKRKAVEHSFDPRNAATEELLETTKMLIAEAEKAK